MDEHRRKLKAKTKMKNKANRVKERERILLGKDPDDIVAALNNVMNTILRALSIKDVRALAIRQHEIEHVLARRWRVWEIFERADKRERGAPAALARSHNGSGSGYSTASALGVAGEQLKGVPPQRRSLRDDPWAIIAAALRRTASSGAHTLR